MQGDEQNKNSKRNRVLDILSFVSVAFFIIPTFGGIWYDIHYGDGSPAGTFTFVLVTLEFINIIPLICAVIWLSPRYNYIFSNIGKKYPFTRTKSFNYFIRLGLPVLIVVLLHY